MTLTEIPLADIRPGDIITRMLAGTIPMQLRVTKVHEELIFCGSWTFNQATGVEEDAELGWGQSFGITGSFITKVEREDAE
jgi:hypothetical protein